MTIPPSGDGDGLRRRHDHERSEARLSLLPRLGKLGRLNPPD